MSEEKMKLYDLLAKFTDNLSDEDLDVIAQYINRISPIALGTMFADTIRDEDGFRRAMSDFAYREQMEEREFDMHATHHGRVMVDYSMD